MADVRDQRALRDALGAFATGVTVVTTLDTKGSAWGFTANSFTSVSLDPPLVLMCLAKNSGSLDTFLAASHYAVNILADEQRELSMRFAGSGADKFDDVAWAGRHTGSPVFDGVAAWIDCRVTQTVDAGDHVIFIGQVVDFATTGAAPLGYCRGAYVPLALDHRLFQATGATTHLWVGAIIEREMAVLLEVDPDSGALKVPMARHLGAADKPGSLLARLADWGVHAPALYVFSVFDDAAAHNVVYRGAIGAAAIAPEGEGYRFFDFDALPFADIKDAAMRSMVERYVRERMADAFGVYVGDARGGIVQALR